MRYEEKGTYRFIAWEGMPEMMNFACDAIEKLEQEKTPCSIHYSRDDLAYLGGTREWYGRDDFSSWQDVRESAGRVWEDGMKHVNEMLQELAGADLPQPTKRTRKRQHNEDHGDIDIDRVFQSDPAYFVETRREAVKGPSTVTILADVGGNAMISAEQLFWRAASIIAVVDRLEEAGYQCEIVAIDHTSGAFISGTPNVFQTLRLKEAGDSLDISYLVNGMSPWAYRIGMFGTLHGFEGQVAYGYGNAENRITDDQKTFLELNTTTQTRFLTGCNSRVQAIEGAKRLLKSFATEEERI